MHGAVPECRGRCRRPVLGRTGLRLGRRQAYGGRLQPVARGGRRDRQSRVRLRTGHAPYAPQGAHVCGARCQRTRCRRSPVAVVARRHRRCARRRAYRHRGHGGRAYRDVDQTAQRAPTQVPRCRSDHQRPGALLTGGRSADRDRHGARRRPLRPRPARRLFRRWSRHHRAAHRQTRPVRHGARAHEHRAASP